MQLQILGPLRVAGEDGEIALGGLKRRAVLGYLLLSPNKVVPTSTLITALWGSQGPVSARKVLHNSVSFLRRALSVVPTISLLTREPGYLLNVDEQRIDFWRFRSLVRRARTMQADNSFEQAVTLLREALALWHGPVLADLAESGFQWPELEAAENARLDAMEDYFDLELSRGCHESVLTELAAMTAAEPRRERLLGQSMLALYRGGRQAEALAMYDWARAELEQTFGVEPGRELRQLCDAIRARDADLLITRTGMGERIAVVADRVPAGVRLPDRSGARAEQVPVLVTPSRTVAERRQVSVLQVCVRRPGGDLDPEHLDRVLAHADGLIRQEIDRFGGIVTGRLGSDWMIVFGALQRYDDDAGRAVLAALAIRDRLSRVDAEPAGRSWRMVVATGPVLVRYRPEADSPPAITGAVVDTAHSFLPFVGYDEIWVNDDTKAQTEAAICYERAPVSSVAWVAVGVRLSRQSPRHGSMIGRDRELNVLASMFDRFQRDGVAQFVVVYGDPGMGRGRLVAEFERMVRSRIAGHDAPLVVRLPPVLDNLVLGSNLCEWCGITPADLPETAGMKLRELVGQIAERGREAERVSAVLEPLLHRAVGLSTRGAETLAAWWLTLERIVLRRGAVLVVRDLELVDHRVLDFVDRMTRPGSEARVLVVAGARPRAMDHLPSWVTARDRVTAVKLLPLPDNDVSVLLQDRLRDVHRLTPKQARPARQNEGVVERLRRTVVSACGGNPALAHEYAVFLRQALRPDNLVVAGGLPPAVERMTAERLDLLPARTRAILQDAAVVGKAVWGEAVAAAGCHDLDDVQPHIDDLVRHGLLNRSEVDPVSGDLQYDFRFPVDRCVAHSQLPFSKRAEKHANVVAWLDRQAGAGDRRVVVLLEHYRRELRHRIASARPGADELASGEPLAAEVVRCYLALANTPVWYPAPLSRIIGELKALPYPTCP